jgi:hypothetical protein
MGGIHCVSEILVTLLPCCTCASKRGSLRAPADPPKAMLGLFDERAMRWNLGTKFPRPAIRSTFVNHGTYG